MHLHIPSPYDRIWPEIPGSPWDKSLDRPGPRIPAASPPWDEIRPISGISPPASSPWTWFWSWTFSAANSAHAAPVIRRRYPSRVRDDAARRKWRTPALHHHGKLRSPRTRTHAIPTRYGCARNRESMKALPIRSVSRSADARWCPQWWAPVGTAAGGRLPRWRVAEAERPLTVAALELTLEVLAAVAQAADLCKKISQVFCWKTREKVTHLCTNQSINQSMQTPSTNQIKQAHLPAPIEAPVQFLASCSPAKFLATMSRTISSDDWSTTNFDSISLTSTCCRSKTTGGICTTELFVRRSVSVGGHSATTSGTTPLIARFRPGMTFGRNGVASAWQIVRDTESLRCHDFFSFFRWHGKLIGDPSRFPSLRDRSLLSHDGERCLRFFSVAESGVWECDLESRRETCLVLCDFFESFSSDDDHDDNETESHRDRCDFFSSFDDDRRRSAEESESSRRERRRSGERSRLTGDLSRGDRRSSLLIFCIVSARERLPLKKRKHTACVIHLGIHPQKFPEWYDEGGVYQWGRSGWGSGCCRRCCGWGSAGRRMMFPSGLGPAWSCFVGRANGFEGDWTCWTVCRGRRAGAGCWREFGRPYPSPFHLHKKNRQKESVE